MSAERVLTEQERSAMQTQLKELAAKDTLSPQEFEDLLYTLWKLKADSDGVDPDNYSDLLFFPDEVNSKIAIELDLHAEYTRVIILDGIIPGYSGESITRNEHKFGDKEWHVGVEFSFHSKFFNRHFEAGDLTESSPTPLSGEDLAKVAKHILPIVNILTQDKPRPDPLGR